MSFIGNLMGTSAYLKHTKGKESESLQLYERAMKYKMTNLRNLLSYATILMRSGNFEKAVEIMRYADKLPGIKEADKNQIRVHYAIAQWKLGKIQSSLDLLEEIHRKGPNGTIYGTLGYMYVTKKDIDKALEYNTEAYEYDDDDYVIIDNMAQTWYFLGEYEKAQELFEKTLEKRPTLVDSLYYLSQILYDKGEYEKACELLERAQNNNISILSALTRNDIDELLEKVKSASAAN